MSDVLVERLRCGEIDTLDVLNVVRRLDKPELSLDEDYAFAPELARLPSGKASSAQVWAHEAAPKELRGRCSGALRAPVFAG